jgi:hypothetical protein
MANSNTVEVDFCVVGGGLAGVCAAVQAARAGIRVALIQDRSVLGGNASSEIRMHCVGADYLGARPGSRETGLIEELRLIDSYRNPERCYSMWDLLLYETVLAEPNLSLFLDTCCVGVKMAGREVSSVLALRNSTEESFEFEARWFADCTGDGRVGYEAGAHYRVGRESKDEFGESLAQDQADRFTLGSSILYSAREHPKPMPFIAPSWIRNFSPGDFRHRGIQSYEYGMWWCEWGGELDTIRDNPKIKHELLRAALGIWDYIKNSGEYPDSANWALEWVGAIPGKRESRRFVGLYTLTEQDLFGGRTFDDQVAYGGWPIDLHPPGGFEAVLEPPCEQHKLQYLYGIPLRSLVSQNVPNLLFAGRNISATHVAFASTRVMATCSVVGQAVGACAAVATEIESKEGRFEAGFHDFVESGRVSEAQQLLIKSDAYLLGITGDGSGDLVRSARVTASSHQLGFEPEMVSDGVTRSQRSEWGSWSDDSSHQWRSVGVPAWIEFEWDAPQSFSEVHLTLDSGLERELTLTLSDHTNSRIHRGAQPEMVREFRILVDGEVVHEACLNVTRKHAVSLSPAASGRALRVEFLGTHGAAEVRLFEVRAYGGTRS